MSEDTPEEGKAEGQVPVPEHLRALADAAEAARLRAEWVYRLPSRQIYENIEALANQRRDLAHLAQSGATQELYESIQGIRRRNDEALARLRQIGLARSDAIAEAVGQVNELSRPKGDTLAKLFGQHQAAIQDVKATVSTSSAQAAAAIKRADDLPPGPVKEEFRAEATQVSIVASSLGTLADIAQQSLDEQKTSATRDENVVKLTTALLRYTKSLTWLTVILGLVGLLTFGVASATFLHDLGVIGEHGPIEVIVVEPSHPSTDDPEPTN